MNEAKEIYGKKNCGWSSRKTKMERGKTRLEKRKGGFGMTDRINLKKRKW